MKAGFKRLLRSPTSTKQAEKKISSDTQRQATASCSAQAHDRSDSTAALHHCSRYSSWALKSGATLLTTRLGASSTECTNGWLHDDPSFLNGASNFHLGSLNYTSIQSAIFPEDPNGKADKGAPCEISLDHVLLQLFLGGWDILVQNTAANALLDSSARYDAPCCDQDTRVEVIADIMDWIHNREAPNRILCMTGAAGSGKSALQQTVAERCRALKLLAASFFFSASDPSRNIVSKVIPTIAYQLGLLHPIIRSSIGQAAESDPLIFSRSLRTQAEVLIIAPLRNVGVDHLRGIPSVIFVDGLDECIDEDHQTELLHALKGITEDGPSYFRLFIASRPEWAIRTALGENGHLHNAASHIRLSDDYDASDDIRRSLWKSLREIGARSSDPRARVPSWPSFEVIESLVGLASGQYIFAKTVIRYVSERRSSPVERLKTVLSWTVDGGGLAKPLAVLDLLYINVLSAAQAAYEAADPALPGHFLKLVRFYSYEAQHPGELQQEATLAKARGLRMVERLYGIQEGTYDAVFSDIRSLLTVRPLGENLYVHIYHKSLSDFFEKESRSQGLYTPIHRVWAWMAPRMLRRIISASDTGMCFSNIVHMPLTPYAPSRGTSTRLCKFTSPAQLGRLRGGYFPVLSSPSGGILPRLAVRAGVHCRD